MVHSTPTTDVDHGRVEGRRHRACRDVSWMGCDRRCADEPRLPHPAMIGRVEDERRYGPSSTKRDARPFAKAVRPHGGIDNGLHWTPDVVFHDDLVRLRAGYEPGNRAVIRHRAMNLARAADDEHGLEARRQQANRDTADLENASP